MKYDYFTPFEELSENLKTILKADDQPEMRAWNTVDDKERWKIVEQCFGPTGLQGKLTEEELEYLTDCNMHTIRRYFEGWTEDDWLAYCKKRNAPPRRHKEPKGKK